ncbi:MAG: hypothetical protein RLZZ15_3578 [Verrucomicrobiota bacterium]
MAFSALLLAAAARAETWRTTLGVGFEGKLSGVYGALVVVAGPTGSRLFSVETLDDDALGRVADFLAARPATPPSWAASASAVATSVRTRLQVLRDNRLVTFEPGARAEPEFYLVYFGAHWCGPCRAFSPDLVRAYTRLQQAWPGRFELIFISSDRDAGEQLNYVREVRMPWPVVKFSALGRVAPLERWAASGIPNLVAVTREGEVLFHSYRGAEYVGPRSVLEDFERLLGTLEERPTAARRPLHRLAVVQHVRAAAGGARGVKPFHINLDPARYQTLEVKSIEAALEIDAHGKVTAASFTPPLPAVLAYQLERDADTWLFLPAVEDGRAKAVKVVLPISL